MSVAEHTEEQIKQTAREWLMRMSLELPSPAEREACQAWRRADSRHEAAYQRFEMIWQDTAHLTELESLAPLTFVSKAKHSSRYWKWSAAAAMAASILLAVVLVNDNIKQRLFPVSSGQWNTQTAQVRELRLSDGSRVMLGARSSVDLSLTDNERLIVLNAGEAFFTVAKDTTRPFVVAIGDRRVQALGTQFEVHRGVDDKVRIAVLEGRVAVSSSVVSAGQQVVAPVRGATAQPPRVERIHHAEPASWRKGRLNYVDTPLREVIADANRYSTRRIEISDPALEALLVSVTFNADQADQMIAGLSGMLPIEVSHPGPDRVVLKSVDSRGSTVSTP